MGTLQRGLTAIAAVAVTVGVILYGFIHENYQLLGLALVAAPMIYLINHPAMLVVGVIGLSYSQIIVPGLPNGLHLVHLLMGFFTMLIVVRNTIAKPSRRPMLPVLACALAFLLVLVAIISQRGIGFQYFGSSSIGGTAYVKIFLCAGFLFCSRYVHLTMSQWRLTIILLVTTSFLPTLAQALYIFSGGAMQGQYYVIQPYVAGLTTTLTALSTDTGVARYESLAAVASSILLFALAFTARGPRLRGMTLVLLTFSLMGYALSGFRGGIIEFAGTLGLYLFLASPRSQRGLVVLKLGLLAVFGLGLLIPLMQHLPSSVQRSFSFLPFVEVTASALANAEASTSWRFELWAYISEFIPNYFWLGRGFTVEIADLMAWSVARSTLLLYYATHDYHNGMLSLLLDTGLPGTIAGVLFMFFGLREAFKPQTFATNPFIVRFYTVAQALFIYQVFKFFVLFGDARDSFSTMFVLLAIILGLRQTERVAATKNVAVKKRMIDPTFGAVVGSS